MSARQQWQHAYRAARSMCRFYVAFRDHFPKDGPLPRFLVDAWDACPGYCATRLFPDRLGFCADVLGIRGLHEGRMLHLRCSVRLPA